MLIQNQQVRTAGGFATSVFAICFLIITFVASVDVYWSVKLADHLLEAEQNPIGVWLIQTGGVALFMACKLFGTVLAMSFLTLLWNRRSDICLAVIVPLSLLALWLFYYLNYV